MTELWNMLVHPLMALLVLAFDVFHDFGLAIVLVTLAIRLILYPLFVAQIRSQRAMQELAPAMSELKEKHGKDKARLAEEQMKLYKERGYNPAMGCLPLIVQMPILFAMYSALQQVGCGINNPSGECRGLTSEEVSSFLPSFIANPVAAGGTLDTTAHWLPWIGGGLQYPDPLYILPILAGATQLVASIMAQPAKQQTNLDQQAKMMQSMAYYFPLITVFIAAGLPSGLAVYWVATTLFQIVQQYFVTGWGRLPRFVPVLANIPSPGERDLHRREAVAITEARRDMAGPSGPGAPRSGKRSGGRKNRGGKR